MALDLPALRQELVPDPATTPVETDYDFFCTTVMATARGRGFLDEYVRRHRNADTQAVLAGLRRIEDIVRAGPAAPSLAHVQDEMRSLAAMIGQARHNLRGDGALSSATKVMALLELLEARIGRMLEPDEAQPPAAIAPPPSRTESKAETGRIHLSVVPPPEPVPSSPSVALLPPVMAGEAVSPFTIMARRAVPAATPEAAAKHPSVFHPSTPMPNADFSTAQAVPLKDRFADVMALSEAERMALFT